MMATLESIDLEYEAYFSTPLFDLPGQSTQVLKALHEAISPLCTLHSSDMQVLGGSLLSDVRIRLSLFNGSAWPNLTTDTLAMRFNRLERGEDFTLCKDCISATEQALKATLADLAVRAVMIKPTLFLHLDTAAVSAGRHIAEVAGTDLQIDLSGLGNATLHRAVALDLGNDEERWEAIFDAYRTKGDEASMTASCRVSHFEGGTLQNLESRIVHLRHVLKALLEGVNLKVSSSLWETPRAEPSP